MKFNKVLLRAISITLILSVWLYWDLSQAKKNASKNKSFKLTQEIDAVTSATTKVSIVRSDDPQLPNPIPTNDASITYEHIEQMVRRAITLAGGFHWVIQSGDMVLLKPNIVEREHSGSGEITDVRVVKALVKIIDEIDHGNIEIVIGEGSPRPMDYEVPYSIRFKSAVWEELWDLPGYQELLTDPYLEGINLRLSNLNGSPPEDPWQDLVPIEIPGGGTAAPHANLYYIHKDVLNADVFITVPVMKSHKAGLTVSLKNQIGIAPSTKYGFSKTGGVPQDNYQFKLIHRAEAPKDWVDEEIVDFCTIADIDYSVVDAIACLETSKEAIRNGDQITNQVRMNCIIAGNDPVAVDHVCARLMGLNPDDIAHITLSERVGLGTNNPDNIKITGANVSQTKHPFKKDPYYTSDYGQSNREWIFCGPFSIDGISNPMDHNFIGNEANVSPIPGQNNWSQAAYFFDDRINLEDYFDNPDDVVSYAFSYFDAPSDQTAELWVGSDEALKIFINGNVVYNFNGNRTFSKQTLVSEKVNVPIQAGENRLLVKAIQKYGYYDFSLNICELESNKNLDGNRVWGLKFRTASQNTQVVSASLPEIRAAEGNDVSVNISTSDLDMMEIKSVQFEFAFAGTVLEYLGIGSGGAILDTWGSVNVESTTPGMLNIWASGTVPLTGSGNLLSLKFNIIGQPGSVSNLELQDLIFNSGNPAASPANGVLTVHTPEVHLIPQPLEVTGANPGTTNPVEFIQIRSDSGIARWTTMHIERFGTCLDSDIQSIELWKDNGDQEFNPYADQEIASGSFHNNCVDMLLDPSQQITEDYLGYFVVVDIAPNVSDLRSTFSLNWNNPNDFSFIQPTYVSQSPFPFSTEENALPVELTGFSLERVDSGVKLVWTAVAEKNVYGYSVERSTNTTGFAPIAFIKSTVGNLPEKSYICFDDNLDDDRYSYRLKIIDLNGTFTYSDIQTIDVTLRLEYELKNCYPNPFNSFTNITFCISEQSKIDLSVYNIRGEKITTLINQTEMNRGTHSLKWNGTDDNGEVVATGVYLVILKTRNEMQQRKVLFVK